MIRRNSFKFLIRENSFTFSLFSMMLTVGFSYTAFSTKLEQKNFNVYGIAKATLRKKTELKESSSLISDYTTNDNYQNCIVLTHTHTKKTEIQNSGIG